MAGLPCPEPRKGDPCFFLPLPVELEKVGAGVPQVRLWCMNLGLALRVAPSAGAAPCGFQGAGFVLLLESQS